MTTSQTIANRLANLGTEAFANDRMDALDDIEMALLDEPFEGIACAGPESVSSDATFPVIMAVACTGHRAWAYPRDAFVLVVVCDVERRTVSVAPPFFDTKHSERPDDDALPPPQPLGADAESRVVDIQRIDLTEVFARAWGPGRHRAWLLSHDWCSNPCDIEVDGTPTPGTARPVAPTPAEGAVTFISPAAPAVPDAPGIALELAAEPTSLRLSAALHVLVAPAHVPTAALTVAESDGRDHPVSAVVPCTLVLTSAGGGAPQVLQMGVAKYGPPVQPGQAIRAGFVLELTEVFGFSNAPHLLWAWVEGVLHGPIVVR